jgi:spore maturation protein CgeB
VVVPGPDPAGGSAPHRILLVGSFWDYAIEWSFVRGFQALGADVHTFDWWREVLPPAPSLAMRRSMWPLGVQRGNRMILRRVGEVRPELVLFFKGLHVRADTLHSIKRSGAAIFCLNPDNPFNPSRTSRSRVLVEALPAWDCYFTWGRSLAERLHALGLKRVHYLPFAWDPERHPHQPPSSQPRYTLSFIGNYSKERERWLKSLLGFDLNIWGPGWERSSLRPRVRGGPIVNKALSDVVRESLISLNLLNPWNIPGHNMRTFEIPGCGGLQLCNESSEIRDLFGAEQEILLFRTERELRDEVGRMTREPDEAKAIAARGHARVESETFVARCAEILEVYGDQDS